MIYHFSLKSYIKRLKRKVNRYKRKKNVNKRKRNESYFELPSPLPCRIERQDLFTNSSGKKHKHIQAQKHTL